jgi:hypothetical protein
LPGFGAPASGGAASIATAAGSSRDQGRVIPRYIAAHPSAAPMARPSQNFTQPVYHAPAFDAVAAVGVVTAAVAVFFLVGLFLAPGLGALAGAQLIGLGAVPIAIAVVQRRPLLASAAPTRSRWSAPRSSARRSGT